MALERQTPIDRRAALAKLERLQAAIATTRRKRARGTGELERYAEQAGHELSAAVTRVEARAAARDASVPAAAPSALAAGTGAQAAAPESPVHTDRRRSRPLALAGLVAAVAVAGAFWLSQRPAQRSPRNLPRSLPQAGPSSSPPARDAASPAAAASEAAPSGAAPAATPLSAPAIETAPAAAAAVPDAPLRVDLTAARAVWLRVMADGRRRLEREVAPGERLTFTATRGIVVRSGDAGGVTLSVNGVEQGVLGRDYAVVTRTIDAPAPPETPPPGSLRQ